MSFLPQTSVENILENEPPIVVSKTGRLRANKKKGAVTRPCRSASELYIAGRPGETNRGYGNIEYPPYN